MYTLSPFVWREGDRYKMLVRVVPRSENPAEKIARVHLCESPDGIHFTMRDRPVIAPGPDEADIDGCEDPTLVIVDRTYYVYYSGWNESKKRGQLLLASGGDLRHLRKGGVALPSTRSCENPKEATIVQARDGSWRLFFEYAVSGASKIGVAASPQVNGPWTIKDLGFDPRPESWDSWHLSTGPVVFSNSEAPVMFYNGATQRAEWRIGWVVFDGTFERVLDRCENPLITPPPRREPGDTDIAFAASAIEEGRTIYVYYSIADKDMMRAAIRLGA
jgi:predicted GH43/DUF377 family glycosyl hydrolase